MLRGCLAIEDYKPQFSGHATFPLRYGWLKKGFDAVLSRDGESGSKQIFLNEDAIARFGVGKNMVESMRHWCQATGIIEEGNNENSLKTTEFGRLLFCSDGLDPFLEEASSLWLIHWKLCSSGVKTTWHWSFNHFPGSVFERDHFLLGLSKLSLEAGWKRVSPNTIKRDIECFVRTYVARPIKSKEAHEDALECPLVELGLIKSAGSRDRFRFVRGRKSSLRNSIFLFAVIEFWKDYSSASHLSFEALMHEPGSPGRVFLLDEADVSDRLSSLDEVSGGKIRWSETAGLKQIIRDVELEKIDLLDLIKNDYAYSANRKVA
ncbi:hypothetical protein A9Q83_04285 [Alphaproteobacteria bacterium 46_93_T64]|nr:hypothetical protein A9Q83_04285 [Alphaproteobacteria bacterium 46_93_T64]